MGGSQKEFFARCAGGFEQVLAQELRALGARRVRPLKGGVSFFGKLADGYRACLWSRVATRIQLVLARVPAADADELYRGALAVEWERHVPSGATIAVDAHGENPQLRNTQFSALRVKDALCDRLRDARGWRPDVDARDPGVAIDVAVHQQKATLYLNLSGTSLHRRGYREDGVQTEAPLKETLAAGLLLAADWPALAQKGAMLIDPMCGSGTLAIEAAMIARDIAPGIFRESWGFDSWAQHDRALWEDLLTDAYARRAVASSGLRVLAGDLDERAIDIARENVRRAGVEDTVRLFVDDAARLSRHLGPLRNRAMPAGLLVANPPYGERLLGEASLPDVYAALSTAVESLPQAWGVALITPDASVDTALGRIPAKTIDCYNGPIRTWVRVYETTGEAPLTHEVVSLAGVQRRVVISEANSAQFAARLRKVARERARWARREGVSCYRVYDCDLPDYALSVDLWQGSVLESDTGTSSGEPERFLVVEERPRRASVDTQRAARRFADAVVLAAALLDVSAGNIVRKPWKDHRASARRRSDSSHHMPVLVAEHGYEFVVDLAADQASTLPLYLRGVRAEAAALASGSGQTAALFAESAAAAVAMLGGGAQGVTLVDGAQERLEAARESLRRNGFRDKRSRGVRAEVRSWLRTEERNHHRYDLVLCVAPEWLSSRDAGGKADWDLQRDHAELLLAASKLLSATGAILFAFAEGDCKPDIGALKAAKLECEDASGRVLPHDFERSRTKPCCLIIRKGKAKRRR